MDYFFAFQGTFCDVTVVCNGKFYSLHKFVLSTCSEYFEQIFNIIDSKNPIIVLKDILNDDLDCLLDYMYVGEVSVEQEKLPSLLKAAECLRIRGLAVPDEVVSSQIINSGCKKQQMEMIERDERDHQPQVKRRKHSNEESCVRHTAEEVYMRHNSDILNCTETSTITSTNCTESYYTSPSEVTNSQQKYSNSIPETDITIPRVHQHQHQHQHQQVNIWIYKRNNT